MKIKHLIEIIIAATAISACSDDMAHRGDNTPTKQKGFLYFNLKEGSDWKDGNTSTRSDVEAPIRFKTNVEKAQPIYLHTKVERNVPAIITEETAKTRGIRYTGTVFDDGKITTLGVYGITKNSSDVDQEFLSPFTQISSVDENPGSEGGWYIEEYGDVAESIWGTGKTGVFYAYAPYFTYNTLSNANGLRSYLDGSTPTIEYDVPTTVSNQLDLLTAYNPSVTKGNDIDLVFDHVLSAIKFKIKGGADHNKWKVGGDTYDVTVNSIKINSVYAKGTWPIATLTSSSVWTNDGSTKKSFELDCVDMTWTSATSSGTDLMDDTNVFMMLPQTAPEGATVELVCTLTGSGTHNNESISMTAPINGKVWKPGYTYTYTISLSGFTYVFDYNEATTKNYNESEDGSHVVAGSDYTGGIVRYNGTSEKDIFIRSYKIDANGTKTNVDWKPQYYETDASVTAVGDGGADSGSWKDGSNGWIHVYDRYSNNYDREVTTSHNGAHEGESNDIRLFKIAIGSIMTPTIDLSEWNQDQTKRWRGRSTSNCYIVAGPGRYRIPLIYGNAWTNGSHNQSAYKTANSGDAILSTFLNYNNDPITSPYIDVDLEGAVDNACLVWEEGNGDENNTTLTTGPGGQTGGNSGTVVEVIGIDKDTSGDDGYNHGYLVFEVKHDTFNYGNAVVGIRNSSNVILWSWHIWIVDSSWFLGDNSSQLTIDGNNITYAKTNIGWVHGNRRVLQQNREGQMRLLQSESGNTIFINAKQEKRPQFDTYKTNVLYQWGRKDPMRGIINASTDNTDGGAPRGAAGVKPWSNPYSFPGVHKSIGALIQDPNTIWGMSRGDLYETDYYNLWAMNCTKRYNTNGGTWQFFGKTIYDPSPVGYVVPPSKCLTHLERSGFAAIEPTVTFPIICNYTDASSGKVIPFYTSGTRTTDLARQNRAMGVKQPETLNAALGWYHTATPYSKDESWQLRLYFYSGTDTHNFIRGDLETANSVLPVMITEATESEDPEVDYSQQYLTITAYGNGSIKWTDSGSDHKNMQYNINNEGWSDECSSGPVTYTISVQEGDVIQFRGTETNYGHITLGTLYRAYFDCDFDYEVSGNIMSMQYGGDFQIYQTALKNAEYSFAGLFMNQTHLISARNLILPATTLRNHCYQSMFEGCTNLIDSPELPAASGQTGCYKTMFKGCTYLENIRVKLDPANSSYTENWLQNASSQGEFYYHAPNNPSSWLEGSDSGIRTGWTKIAY